MRNTSAASIVGLILALLFPALSSAAPVKVTPEEAYQIGIEAYVYLYPLITMDVTRQQMTNTESGKMIGRGPMNTFSHMTAFPTADFSHDV